MNIFKLLRLRVFCGLSCGEQVKDARAGLRVLGMAKVNTSDEDVIALSIIYAGNWGD